MFDRTIINQRDTEVVYQDRLVPIDASHAAKLLQDVEEKAQERITKAITIEGNGFTALLQFWREPMHDKLAGRLTFDLNGKRHVVDDSTSGFGSDPWKLIDKLQAKAADLIAAEILKPAVVATMSRGHIGF